ncbi:MAG TPA: FtsX-like permease family protein, partial [Terriglobales bacterium]|nr:FtsX-like permease family protein [Terriglobales bacterium]
LRELPWLETVSLDPYVFVFTIAVAVTAAMLFGVAPAVSGSRTAVMDALKAATARIAGGREHRWLRHAFVAGELALALLLLVGAGLLVRSFVALMSTDPGYDPTNVISARVRFPMEQARSQIAMAAYSAALLARARALPGVRYAALSSSLPLHGYSMMVMLSFHPTQPEETQSFHGPTTFVTSITPDFFRAMGTPLLEGRPFSGQDNEQSIAVGIVNQAFARQYLNGEPLGKVVYSSAVGNCANCFHNRTFMPVQIVGAIPDVRHDGLEKSAQPELYLPYAQMPHFSINVVLKTDGDPRALAAPLRSAVLAINPTIPAYEVATLESQLSEALAQRRLTMFLLSAFAALALLLAAIGVYGVISYAVLQRTQEIGIRMALGATRGGVLRLVLGQQARIVLLGSAAGVALALASSGLLASLLYGVKPRDGFTFAASWLVLTAVALLASITPALKATRCEPTVALRYE